MFHTFFFVFAASCDLLNHAVADQVGVFFSTIL